MATVNFSNGATSTINGTLTSGSTTVNVASASGFPAAPFYALIAAEGANKDEIVRVTDVSSNTFTISRAAEPISDGTQVAQAHTAGARISHVLTAGGLLDTGSFVQPTTIVYEGSLAGGTGAINGDGTLLYSWNAAPFTLTTGTSVNRVRLYLRKTSGSAYSDITVSLRADNAGVPSATSLSTVLIPMEFIGLSYRYYEVPLNATGLTNGATYWIVIVRNSNGNALLIGLTSSASSLSLGSSTGSSWVSQGVYIFCEAYAGATGNVVATVENAGTGSTAHGTYTELAYDGNGRVSKVYEYYGSYRNIKTLTYDATSGALASVA